MVVVQRKVAFMSNVLNAPDADNATAGMCHIPGGEFLMGSDRHYPEEAPVHRVRVGAFWMDATTVTNAQFGQFIAATGYVTVAERPLDPAMYPGATPRQLKPGALVFQKTPGPVPTDDFRHWWTWTTGACWRHPDGRGSGIQSRPRHPVVQVAYEDAEAYAAWVGKSLPTEAEWEFAARGGLDGAEFVWGDELTPGGVHMANTWQGAFPWQNLAEDGFHGAAPVASFPPNAYGLFDMAGNVWQWTTDWFAHRHAADPQKACCMPADPRGPAMEGSYDFTNSPVAIPRKAVKGGSFLCAPSYCRRYRPAARHAQMVDSGMSHIGFRCIIRRSSEPSA